MIDVAEKYRLVENWVDVTTKPLLRTIMLSGPIRKLVIVQKAIFQKAIRTYASILPGYKEHGVLLKNTVTLIEAKEKFFETYDITGREQLVEDGWDILIHQNEHDPSYAWIIDFMMKECKDKWVFDENVEIPKGWKRRS